MIEVPNDYGEQLSQLEPWREMVDIVLARHGFDGSATKRMGKAGTFPTVLVENNCVVKLFSPFLDWFLCFDAEVVACQSHGTTLS